MTVKEFAFLHAEFLGRPLNEDKYDYLLDRASQLNSFCKNKTSLQLAAEFDLSIERSFDSCSSPFLTVFSLLNPAEKKIVLYMTQLQEIDKLLHNCLNIEKDNLPSFEEISLLHELCHFMDTELFVSHNMQSFGRYSETNLAYGEILVRLFITERLNLSYYSWLLDLCFIFLSDFD